MMVWNARELITRIDRTRCHFLEQSGLRRGRTRQAIPPTELGVNVIGCFQAESGLGQAARGTAAAIQAVGLPHTLINRQLGCFNRQQDHRWDRHFAGQATYAINLWNVNPYEQAIACAKQPELLGTQYQIGYWVWELPEFPEHWRSHLKLVDEIWAPTQFVVDALSQQADCPVYLVPYAIEIDPPTQFARQEFNLSPSDFVFLMMYDSLSIVERKNPWAAVTAFRQAFPTGDDVRLVIKVINAQKNDPFLRQLQQLDDGRIQLVSGTLSREATWQLIDACDALVSLHRSEGFGLALAEAMALGKPVIATNWSGNIDFMSPENACLVDFELIKSQRAHGPYPQGSTWAEPRTDDAASWMRRLASEDNLAAAIGQQGREFITAQLSPENIGSTIRQRLQSCIERT